MWWAGQQDDNFLATIRSAGEPLPGRGAVGIAQNQGSGNDVCLLEIIGRHLHFARGESVLEAVNDFRIAMKLELQCFGYCFSCEIVFRWPQAAHENDDVRTRYGEARRGS